MALIFWDSQTASDRTSIRLDLIHITELSLYMISFRKPSYLSTSPCALSSGTKNQPMICIRSTGPMQQAEAASFQEGTRSVSFSRSPLP
jgi:hypothetical protein